MTRRNGRASAAVACAVMAGTWNGLGWITVEPGHPVHRDCCPCWRSETGARREVTK